MRVLIVILKRYMNSIQKGRDMMGNIFTFIGTIIGAGFASGQEIKKYFADFGNSGLIGIILVTLVFIFFGEKIMLMGYTSDAQSYEDILGYGFRCKFRKVVDYILCFCLVATASTMFSGTGAFFSQTFNVSFWLGSLVMAVVTFCVTILGINRIMKISSFIVPVLILCTCVISVASFNVENFNFYHSLNLTNIFEAVCSSVIYGAYNIVMGLAVLPVLGSNAKDKKEIRIISLVSGIIIGIFGCIIYFALLTNYDKIQSVEIPIAVLAGSSYSVVYGVSFIIAVLTTAVGCLYGVYTRFNKNIYVFFITCIISYVISLFGFSTLVAKLYYVMGIFGVFLIMMLLIGYNKRRFNRKG